MGCGGGASRPFDAHRTLLTSGVAGGARWQLWASLQQEDGLCLDTTGPDVPDAVWSGACGWGEPDPGRPEQQLTDSDSSRLPDGRKLAFGPTPPDAVTVRLTPVDLAPQAPGQGTPPAAGRSGCTSRPRTPVTVRVTHRLPAWSRPGGWYVAPVSGGWCVYDVTFLSADGRRLPLPDFRVVRGRA